MTQFRLTTRLLLLLLLLASFGRQMVLAAPDADYYDEPGVRLLNQPLTEYRARRQKLMSEVKDGIVVILGNVEDDVLDLVHRGCGRSR